jgi:hypothetical protein
MAKKKSVKPKRERKLERELLLIFGFLGILVVLFLVSSSIFQAFNKVEYEGLVFTKEKFGEIPVFHYSYYFRAPTGRLIQFNLFVRNDPTTNEIPVEGGQIRYNGQIVWITLDTATGFEKLTECEDSTVAIADLTKFLADNQLEVKSGNMDFTEAAIYNQEHVTCETHAPLSVIQIMRGEETKIDISRFCNTITVGPSCDILEAIEKFKIHSYLDAQERGELT